MLARETIPLWDSVTHPLANALEFAFGCHHRHMSRVFTMQGHSYKVCCDCGATFNYSLESMSIRHRPRLLSALRRLQRRKRALRQAEREGFKVSTLQGFKVL